MPKLNPYYVNMKLPETATVSYFNEVEWDKGLTPKEIEKQEVLRNSYIAEWEEWGKTAGYGPGFGSWFVKALVSTGAGMVLGPAAIPIGAAIWGTSELIVNNTDDDSLKTVFGHVSDVGKDTLTGGCLGVAAKGVGAVAGFEKVAGLGKNAGNCIASAKHGMKVAERIEILTGKGFELKDATMHVLHKFVDGIEYKVGCKVCES